MENQVGYVALCPKCRVPVQPEFYFCPQCGRKLKSKPISTSVVNQTIAYAVSFLLPPLGLYYTYKYFKLGTGKGKIIAWVTIILTVVSLFFSLLLFKDIFSAYQQYLNQFQGLGI